MGCALKAGPLALILALTLGGSSLGAAADPTSEARSLFDAGQQAYAAGYYLEAAQAFQQAIERVPNPAITFSLAQCFRLQYFLDKKGEHLQRAIELYRRYLAEAPKGSRRDDAVSHLAVLEPMATSVRPSSPTEAAKAETQLMISSRTPGAMARVDGSDPGEVPVIRAVTPGEHAVEVEAPGHSTEKIKVVAVAGRLVVAEVTLKEQPARITVSAPDDSEVSVDGRPMGVTPLLRPLELSPGRHYVVVSQVGREPYARELELDRGQSTSVLANLENTTQRGVSYAFLGTGGALLLGSGACFLAGLAVEGRARELIRKRDDAQQNLTVSERDEYQQLLTGRTQLYAVSTGTLIGGTVLFGIGGLLYFLDNPKATPVSGGSGLVPMIDGGGQVGLGYSGRF